MKTIPDFPFYKIDKKGNIFSIRSNRFLKLDDSTKYNRICFFHNKHLLVHRLMAHTYLGLDLKDWSVVVNHKDLNKRNNNLNNLEIVSQSDNIKHYWVNRKLTSREKEILELL